MTESQPAPPAPSDDEQRFVAALRRGDEAAYERLVAEHAGPLLAVARRYLPDDEAEDALQEAFLSALRAIDRFEGKSRLSTWLHRIVVNAALMRRRQRVRQQAGSLDELLPRFASNGHHAEPPAPWTDTGPEQAQRHELAAIVRAAIDRLPAGYRDVLLLRDIEGLDTAETARALDMTPAAVKTRLHRARLALRTLLDPHLKEPSP